MAEYGGGGGTPVIDPADDTPKIVRSDNLEEYTNKLKTKLRWSGTRAEYNLIATKDQYTVYYITDEKKIIRNGIEYGGGSGEYLPLTGGTLTGNLNVSTSSPTLILDADNAMYAQRNGAAALCMNMLQMNSGGIELTHLVKSTPASGPEIRLNNDGTWSLQATTAGGTVASTITGSSDGKVKLNGSDIITQTMLEAFFNRIYPVGITYVQYTDTDNPNSLFPGTTWEDITNTIVSSGCRYPAFSPLNVGTKLDQELPNIRGEMNATPCAAAGWVANGAFNESGKRSDYGCGYGNNYANGHYIFNANQSNGIYKDGANVQPYTYTVKLWQRTA